MVYNGQPSTGCTTCRQRKIKCDEGRPICMKCIKSRRQCLGYRNISGFEFRDETSKTKARSKGTTGYCDSTASTISNVTTAHTASISMPMMRDEVTEALCYFFTELIFIPRHIIGGQGPLSVLPQLYFHSGPESPIFPITSAVALCYFSHQRQWPVLKRKAEKIFGEAIVSLRAAVADPIAVKQDDTLLTMMLCSFWEAFSANIESKVTWGQHAEGRSAVIRLRGKEMQGNPISERLFQYTVRNEVVIKISRRQPMELPIEVQTALACSPTDPEAPVHGLTSIGVNIANLRAQALILRTSSTTADLTQKLSDLLQQANMVDQELIGWILSLPPVWRFDKVRETDCGDCCILDSPYYPGPVYSYYDLWTASLYDMWRVFRIFVQMIVLNCLERLTPAPAYLFSEKYNTTVLILKELVNGICATLPFQEGLEGPISCYAESVCPSTAKDTLNTAAKLPLLRPNIDMHRKIAKNFAGMSTYLPVFIAFAVPCVPEEQRRWLRKRYFAIGERYHLAQMVAVGKAFMTEDYSSRSFNIVDYAPPPFETRNTNFMWERPLQIGSLISKSV